MVADGGCQGSHIYTTGGEHDIVVTVNDDDGGTGTASTTIRSDAPPNSVRAQCGGQRECGDPGVRQRLRRRFPDAVVDRDGRRLSGFPRVLHLRQSGVASTTVTCTDDGTWTLTLTANDGVNPPVSASATLTVSNAAPTVSIDTPAAGSYVGTPAITLNAPFTDPGSNDTQTCTVDWGVRGGLGHRSGRDVHVR